MFNKNERKLFLWGVAFGLLLLHYKSEWDWMADFGSDVESFTGGPMSKEDVRLIAFMADVPAEFMEHVVESGLNDYIAATILVGKKKSFDDNIDFAGLL